MAILTAGGMLFSADSVSGQAGPPFRVSVHVASDTGEPIDGALIRLQLGDSTVALQFSDERGLVIFDVDRATEYRLMVERLGFAEWTSERIRIDESRDDPIELVIPLRPVSLEAIVVPSERKRCSEDRPLLVRVFGGLFGRHDEDLSPDQAATLVRLHDRTMSSLRSIIAARPANATYLLRIVGDYPTWTDSSTGPEGTALDSSVIQSTTPLNTPSVETPVTRGYAEPATSVDGRPTFYPLSPEVITSDGFSLTHCFRVVEDSASGWLGLAFEPLPRSVEQDVRGIVWMDTTTTDWQPIRVEFGYTRLGQFLVESGEWERARRRGRRMARTEYLAALQHIDPPDRSKGEVPGGEPILREELPAPEDGEFGGIVEFGDVDGGRKDVTRWIITSPVLLGSARYLTYHVTQPIIGYRYKYREYHVRVFGQVLKATTTVEVDIHTHQELQ